MENFQPFRRVLVIIGLINFPELGDVNIEKELARYANKYPHIIIKRVFVFNYSFEDTASITIPQCPTLDPGTLEIFPPDKESQNGDSMVRERFIHIAFVH